MRSYPLRGLVAKCRSWEQFRQELAERSDKEKGDLFEHLVRAYLQLDPEYATKLRKVWLLEDVPSAVRKMLKLPDDDQGIDLIAETNTGEYWAIQCKYREDTARPLPWREISTFTGLAFGVCKHISFGLVCSTTERITHVLTHQDRIGFCSLDVWQGLDKEFFDRLRKLLGHKPTKLVPLKPRPHQKKAIADARKHFVGKKQKRGKLISPCGSGKSLTAYWIARDLKAKRIVVAVPSLALIRQTLRVWLRESLAHGDTVEWICVCSDESAGRVEQDDVAVLRQDLGVPCFTDPNEIASWLKQKKPGLTVVFTTYQSGEALGKAARRAKFAFDLGIMDEAHKTVGDGDKLFSHLLHDKNLPIRRRIFMTATERRYRGKSDKILSMDNAAIYGDTFHLLSFKQALANKPAILSDYRIVTILVSREEVADLIRKNVFVKPDKGRWTKEIEAEMLASLVALRKAMRKYPIKHVVSFHSSIQRAEIFKNHNEAYNQAFKKHGAIEAFHVSGKTPTGTRARIVNEFAATERGLITNARCLTEGIDVPGIDCVMFADPRRSAVDIVQAVGRALRPAKGKMMGYVIVPILHDAKAQPDDIFDSEEFQEILTTLRALAANDERIIEYFRTISRGKRPSGGGSVVFDVDEKLSQQINLEQFVHNIDLRCWDKLAKLSWMPFAEARSYVHKLRLKSHSEWSDFCKVATATKDLLPGDIPRNPRTVYADSGWISMGDWLGTGTVAPQLRRYRRFREARDFAQALSLKSVSEWRKYIKGQLPRKQPLPDDIPRAPDQIYTDQGWLGFGDWLGTGTIASFRLQFRRFEAARKFIRGLKFSSSTEFRRWAKGAVPDKGFRPADIPSAPHLEYASCGWKSYGDWIGTNSVATRKRKYRSFRQARQFVRTLGLSSQKEWFAFTKGKLRGYKKFPSDIPTAAHRSYANSGWTTWGDWLGTNFIANTRKKFRPFKAARSFVHELKIKDQKEWLQFCKGELRGKPKRPDDIPVAPDQVYAATGWAGTRDWFGTPAPSRKRNGAWPFEKARHFVHALKLYSSEEWQAYSKKQRPPFIPSAPHITYKNEGWKGLRDWLGTPRKKGRKVFRHFTDARRFVRSLHLGTTLGWRAYAAGKLQSKGTRPADLPSNPQQAYAAKGWVSWSDWLSTDRNRKAKRRR